MNKNMNMKNILKYFRLTILILLVSLLFLPLIPVSALSNPTSIAIPTLNFFNNIFASGDGLLVVDSKLIYTVAPSESAADTYMLELWNVAGTVLIFSNPLNAYGERPISLYFTQAQMTDNITWGSAYKVKIAVNPAYLTRTEGTTVKTWTMGANDWWTGTNAVNLARLKTHCLTIASNMEVTDNTTYTATQTDGTKALNSTGGALFQVGIPGLSSVLPSLFATSMTAMSVDQPTGTGALAGINAMSARFGTRIWGYFEGIGTFFGTSGEMAAGIYWLIMFGFILGGFAVLAMGDNSGDAVLALLFFVTPFGLYYGFIPTAVGFGVFLIMTALGVYKYYAR